MKPKKLKPEFTFNEERIQALKQIAPEAFVDGRIDFDTLKEALGEVLEEEREEHFGLNWPGKREARKIATTPSAGTLLPAKGEGINEDTTGNIYIEGENLEVLKLLQKSYVGQIKVICIDPPYNTGNDFIYDDDFSESIEEYLKRTGQSDEEGKPLTTNTRSDGRFHSKWLSMMYPRLRLARNLLREDGVIFVHIDDNEVHNLRQLMNEVFGEENFVGIFIWKSRVSEDTRALTGISSDHEYILIFRKSDNFSLRGSEKDLSKFSNPDDDPRGPWRSADATGLLPKSQRPNCHYDLIDPKTNIVYVCPPKGWRFDKTTMSKKIEEGRILFPKDKNGRPRHKLFLNEMESNFKNISSIIVETNTSVGSRSLTSLMGESVFQFPKPQELIKIFIEQSSLPDNDDLILDFFSGSGTIAHAVLDLNKEDGGIRKFICVQIPEPTDEKSEAYKAGYKTIAEIGKERIRRVIRNLEKEESGKLKLSKKKTADEPEPQPMDLGFKVFKLNKSHFKLFQPKEETEMTASLFEDMNDPLVSGWKPDDLLVEILLMEGFRLDSKIEACKESKKNKVVKVTSETLDYALYICLDKKLQAESVNALLMDKEDVLVCLDSALEDSLKLNLSEKYKLHTI